MSEQAAQPQPEQRFEIEISPDVEPGVYADFASIWHTRNTFVLDFASLRQPPVLGEDEDSGQPVLRVPTRIVARVKIPSDQIFELMRALEQQLSAWERETGQSPPQEPGLPNRG
jgi:Protein of unknown function (DUF3467)